MGNRVKCQHCWKVFEIPDHALNKQQKCVFCQRMTAVQPMESKKSKTTRQMKNVLEESNETKVESNWNIVVFLVLMLIFVNLSFSCCMLLSSNGSVSKEKKQESQKKLDEMKTQIAGLENQIGRCYGALERLEENIEPANEINTALILEVGQRFKSISRDLDVLQEEITQLPKKK